MAINKDDYEPTTLEQVAGHPAVTAAATAVAAGASVGAAIFLPILTGTLAARRHEERLAKFINDVSDDLMVLERRLDELSDAQYQLIGDAVTSALHTLDRRKLEFLRLAITNSLNVDIPLEQSAFIARAIRDISVEEAKFLLRIGSRPITTDFTHRMDHGLQYVSPDSKDFMSLTGLVSLGVFRDQAGYGGSITVRTSGGEVVSKLLGGH